LDHRRTSEVYSRYYLGHYPIALKDHGRQWKLIEGLIPSRTSSQIRTHAQKFFIRLKQLNNVDDDELLAFIREHDVDYFIDEDSNFAVLGVEKGKKQHICPKFHSNSCDIIGKRIKSEDFCNGQPQAAKTKFCETGAGQPIQAQLPSISSLPISQLSLPIVSTPPRLGLDSPHNLELRNTQIIQMASQIIQENIALAESLKNAYENLAGYCQNVALQCFSVGPEKEASKNFTEYLYKNGVSLQCKIKDIIGSHAKSIAMMNKFIMNVSMLGSNLGSTSPFYS